MLSPGVEVREIDLSLRVDQVSNSIACFGGIFEKGPVDDKLLITSVEDFISFYGYPSNDNFNQWFQVYNFLQYANKIWVARAFNTLAGNSFGYVNNSEVGGTMTSGNAEDRVFIKNGDDWEQMFLSVVDTEVLARKPKFLTDSNKLFIAAQTFGTWGDKIQVGIANKRDFIEGKKVAGYKFEDLFEYHPGNEIFPATISADSMVTELEDEGELYFSIRTKVIEEVGEELLCKVKRGTVETLELLPIVQKEYNANLNITELVLDVTFDGDLDKKWTSLPDLIVAAPKSLEIAFVVLFDGNIVEKFIVSMDPTAKDYTGKSTYITNVINRQSGFVYVMLSSDDKMPASINDTTGLLRLAGSFDNTASGDVIDLYATNTDGGIFANKEEVDIDIVIANELCNPQAILLAKDRSDCIAFIGAKAGDAICNKSAIAVNNLIEYVTVGELNVESSFAAFFGNYKYQYDKYNDVYRWVNIAGDVAGLRADTSTKREIWWASAGIERGQILNAVKLAFNPTQGERDLLYKNKINPIVSFPGQGNAIVWGQKTLQSKASAFDRINVRGLFNTLERAISIMAKNYVFEINDEFTRFRFESTVNSYLREIKANRGVYDFFVRCNEQNNTPQVVDSNQFIADIAIKPTRTAEFITLNFIAVSTGVEFNEIFA
jgi:hypothetical protein